METNLTPAEIAAIEEKAEKLYPDANNWIDNLVIKGQKQGYIAAACEYAAEIKRLRDGVESVLSEFAMDMGYAAIDLRELLNNQP